MTYLLILHLLNADGYSEHQKNMAVFTDREDCRTAGYLLAKYYTEASGYSAVVKFECQGQA